jgi:hypothetical protein
MHCDDKRTIFALKQFLADSELELQQAVNQLKTESNVEKRLQIKERILYLEKESNQTKEQLLSME